LKNENFIVIKGFMLNELHLKGTALLVYAIIYGFSQDGKSGFSGGIHYLMEWTGTSYKTICEILKQLTAENLLYKTSNEYGGVNTYMASYKGQESEITAVATENERKQNVETKKHTKETAEVIEYLNNKVSGKYRPNSTSAASLEARFNEGYTVSDAKTVIDNMYDEWNGTDFARYLRPQTLFGPKFASYLIRRKKEQKPAQEASYDLNTYTNNSVTKKIVYKKKGERA